MKRKTAARGRAIAALAGLALFATWDVRAQEVIKIGMILAKQGPFALQGEDLAAGVQLALQEAGGKVLGKRVELTWLDEPNPQAAVQNITKLIDEQKVAAVIGGTGSATSLAMGAVALRSRVPFITVNAAAREVTGKDCNPYMFRVPPSVPVYARSMAPYLLSIGKKWYFIAGSFAFGEDVITTFTESLTAAGGTVVGVDRVPVATTDYSSFVLKARAAKPDVVVSGAVAIEPLLKQFKELGLSGKLTLSGPAVSDPDIWSAGTGAVAGIFGKTWYFNDPANSAQEKAFVKSFRDKNGKPPSDKVFGGWLGMRLLLAAIEAAKSEDPVRITHALEDVQIPDGGQMASFRKWDHQLLRRLVVASAKVNPPDKWDVLDVKAAQGASVSLDQMYGSQAEVGCHMAPI